MVRVSTELEERRLRREEDGEDRISQLPDGIIHSLILHCLDSSEEAAKTSVVSRRWLQLWRSYPFVDFKLSKSNQSQFSSFVASTSRRLLPPRPASLDHSGSSGSCSAVAAIQVFNVSVDDDEFQKEELDQLLLLFTAANGLSLVKFLLIMWCSDQYPFHSLPVMNWSRTKFIMLIGCDLTAITTFGVHGDRSNVVSLGSLEEVLFHNVSLSEQLLYSLLDNAPRIASLRLAEIYGIDRLELVSYPCLTSVVLYDVYRVGRPGSDKMRRLRISSPKLQDLRIGILELEELEVDAPNLLSFSWAVSAADTLMNVQFVSLASNCKSSIRWIGSGLAPQRLRRSLSTTFTKFNHMKLVFTSNIFSSAQQQVSLGLSQVECGFPPPPTIDQVQHEPLCAIDNIEDAAAFLDDLFWACRPRFMSITKREGEGLDGDLVAECMCREYLKIDSHNGANAAAAAWRRHLKDMKIENDTTGEMMEISKDVIPSLDKRNEVRFMLTWC